MLSKSLNAFANAYGFAVSENFAYGKIGRYMVSVCDDCGKKTAFITFFVSESDGEEGAVQRRYALAEDIKALSLPALKDYALCDGGLIVSTNEDLKSFDEAILAVCRVLENAGCAGAEKCSCCGAGIDAENSYVGVDEKHVSLLCAECAEDFADNHSEAATEKTCKSKKRGILSAFTACAVFCVLFVLLFVFAIPHYGIRGDDGVTVVDALLFAILFSAVMALASFTAYRIFTGRKGAERLLPCACFSALFSVILVYLASAAEYAKMCGLNFSLALKMAGTSLKAPFKDPFVRNNFWVYTVYCVIAVVVVTLLYSIALENKKDPRCVLLKYGETESFSGFSNAEDQTVAESGNASASEGSDESKNENTESGDASESEDSDESKDENSEDQI